MFLAFGNKITTKKYKEINFLFIALEIYWFPVYSQLDTDGFSMNFQIIQNNNPLIRISCFFVRDFMLGLKAFNLLIKLSTLSGVQSKAITQNFIV